MDNKEKLELARDWYNDKSTTKKEKVLLENLFSELKESEDERIRNEMLSVIRQFDNDSFLCGKNYDYKKWIAWLERQCEPQPYRGNSDTMRKNLIKAFKSVGSNYWGGLDVRDIIHWLEDAVELERQGEKSLTVDIDSMVKAYEQRLLSQSSNVVRNSPFIKMCVTAFKHGVENTLDELHLKQGEQKPANKVKPWFLVGDWVVYEAEAWREVLQIKIIESERYTFTNGSSSSFDEEQNMRLWTIQDAKDGDVLDANGAPFIYKKHDKDYVYFHCGVNLTGEFVEANGSDTWSNNHKVYPATKEQRDLLFSKMKEAGFEWEAEKKELKKIEQNSADSYCQENCKGYQETGKCFADGECKAKRDAEQNPAWSEEDENIIDDLIQTISQYTIFAHREPKEIIQWLKSLKPQPHWKPTDEQMSCFRQAIDLFKMKVNDDLVLWNLHSLYNDLKKL